MSSPSIPVPSQVKVAASQKAKAPLQRRGPKGYFKDSRKEFLESWLPAYKTTKRGNRQAFWHKFYCSWWQRYPWKLSDDEEPPTDNPARMANLAALAPGEENQKKEVERRLKERLTQWFVNHASTASESRRDTFTWLPLLQRLHQIRNPRPRCRTTVHQFMLDYPSELNAAFVSKYADGKGLTSGQRMNLRYETAKSLLSNRFSHLVKELDKKAAAQHEADMDEWNMVLSDISAAKDIPKARDSLFDAVHPLLHAIGSYAGCYISLIAGSPEKGDDKGFFTAVHWWPGDRDSTKDWTQWDDGAFNAGVAGPFLAYAAETDQLLQAAKTGTPPPVTQTPGVTPSLTPPNAAPIVDDTPSVDNPPSTHNGSTAATTARYRPLPARNTAPAPTRGTRKRKHTSKSRPIRYFEDTESEEDNFSGDGSSSGGSVSGDVLASKKRQRTSGIITRSSTQAPAPDVGAKDGLSVASQAPTLTLQPLPAILNVDAMSPVDDLLIDTAPTSVSSPDFQSVDASATTPVDDSLTGTAATSIGSPDPQSVDASEDVMDVDDSLDGSIPRANSRTSSNSGDISSTEIQVTRDINTLPIMDTVVSHDTAAIESVPKATPSAGSSIVTPTTASHSLHPPVLSSDIDVDSVPAFLRSHGKGKRKVNIFGYLDKVKDPRFQQVLQHYIHIEANDRSGVSGSLPTAKRPVEISEWLSRARPDYLPDFTKGKRSFSDFVDSTFAWWGSIQPRWRSFERGIVSREVCGEWDVLYAPCINGLLNVVILVYWWARILEEQKPKEGVRADYEQFAEDVAWVLSNLSN